MAIQIKKDSTQAISVTIRDTTGYVTSLSGSEATFDIYSVDPDTDANTLVLGGQQAVVSGLNVKCIINTTYWRELSGTEGYGIANNAPTLTLPLTVVAGVNDKYIIPSIFFGGQLVNPGTYTTIQQVALAMTQALGEFNDGYAYYYSLGEALGSFAWDAIRNRITFLGTGSLGNDSALNGLTITSGGAQDFLAGTGWDSGQTLLANAVDATGRNNSPTPTPLAVGRYRLYVNFFSVNSQAPRLGPVEFFVY